MKNPLAASRTFTSYNYNQRCSHLIFLGWLFAGAKLTVVPITISMLAVIFVQTGNHIAPQASGNARQLRHSDCGLWSKGHAHMFRSIKLSLSLALLHVVIILVSVQHLVSLVGLLSSVIPNPKTFKRYLYAF